MKAAGVQKQSLYCAFGDKHSLFVKSVELYKNQVLSQVKAIIDETNSPLAALDRVMRFAIMPTKARNCPEGCLAANTALELGLTDPEAAGEVKKMFRGLEEIFGKAIKKGQKIYVGPGTIITPSARDLGEPVEVFVLTKKT